MSNKSNEELLERVRSTIDLAQQHIEYWTHTPISKTLDMYVAQVTKHVADNNLDDLYNYSLPSLELRLIDSAVAMGGDAMEYFYGYDELPKEYEDVQ